MRLTTDVVGVRGSRSPLWPKLEGLADEAARRMQARIERIGFRLNRGWRIGPVDAGPAEAFLRETFADLIGTMEPEDVALAVEAMRASCGLTREPDAGGVRLLQAMSAVQREHHMREAPLTLPAAVAKAYREGYGDVWSQSFLRCSECRYAIPHQLTGPCPLCGGSTRWDGTPFRDMGPPEEVRGRARRRARW